MLDEYKWNLRRVYLEVFVLELEKGGLIVKGYDFFDFWGFRDGGFGGAGVVRVYGIFRFDFVFLV